MSKAERLWGGATRRCANAHVPEVTTKAIQAVTAKASTAKPSSTPAPRASRSRARANRVDRPIVVVMVQASVRVSLCTRASRISISRSHQRAT